MMKQIEIYGQQVELYSPDKGRTWSSNPRSIVAYGQRKTMLRLELQKSFELLGDMPDPDSTVFNELEIPKSLLRRQEDKMWTCLDPLKGEIYVAALDLNSAIFSSLIQ